jgi:hypothetical protein
VATCCRRTAGGTGGGQDTGTDRRQVPGVEQVLHQVDRRDHGGGQPQLGYPLLDGPLGIKDGNSGVGVRARAGDEDQVRWADRQ